MTEFTEPLSEDSPGVPSFEPSALRGLLEGTDSGLALFDAGRRLVYCNGRYRDLCGYSPSEARPGVTLEELARISIERISGDAGGAEDTIRRGLERLSAVGGYSFRFVSLAGVELYVHRRMLEDGQVVETVRVASARGGDAVESDRLEMMANAARTRMSHALESMADGFALFDADDRLIAYNRRYVELNPQIADIIAPGRKFADMLEVAVERRVFEFDGTSPEDFFRWRMGEHRNPDEPNDLQLSDGRWVRIHERRTEDGGIVGIRTDITELKERELEILRVSDELRSRNIHFEAALDNMVQGLCMFGPDQTLLVCNKRYMEIYGLSPEVAKPGMRLDAIMDYSIGLGNYTAADAERTRTARLDHARLKTEATLNQYLADGRIIAVMHHPVETGGSIATYQDITDLERSQQRLERYTKQLEVSNRELQDFAYVASHDLQEPLRKIETFGDRLKTKYGDDLPEGGQKYVERMQSATSRMRLLINDLLSYSRVTTNAKPFVKIDLGECLEGVVGDLQIGIEETGAEIRHENLPVIDADRTQMRQLLQNLVSNALKFQRPGVTPVVTVTAEIVRNVVSDSLSDTCILRIADNGIGFDNKYKDQIFTIFQRLHGRGEYEGTGIGLATVRKIVERHEGLIDADGVEGEGATFIVTLPVTQKPQDEE